MARERAKSSESWLTIRCAGCRAALRIKAAYASLRGRCPECGYRIEPKNPSTNTPSHFSHADEPLGLVPIEDEWPEPAQVINAEGPEDYRISDQPVQWSRPAPAAEPVGDAYGFAGGDQPIVGVRPPPPHRFEPPAEPYEVTEAPDTGPPPERHLPTEEEVARLMPEPPPPPPRFSLFSGLYTFPWRPANLAVWLANSMNFTILALIVAVIAYLFELGGHALIGVPIMLAGAIIILSWAAMYFANCFLAAIEDTANGNDAVAWPKGGGLLDGLGKFFYIAWMLACAVVPTALVWVTWGEPIESDGYGWVVSLVPFLIIFPILILSALSGGQWWMLLDAKVIANFIKRPHALALLIVPVLPMLAVCVYFSSQLVRGATYWTPLVVGFGWATFVLIYARLLGRAGWILTYTGKIRKRRVGGPPRRKPRPKPKAVRDDGEDEELDE